MDVIAGRITSKQACKQRLVASILSLSAQLNEFSIIVYLIQVIRYIMCCSHIKLCQEDPKLIHYSNSVKLPVSKQI